MAKEKGLARSGNARVRRCMLQLAWRFLMFQKDSALVKWFASAGDDRDDALIQCITRSESAAAAPAARYYASFVPCLAGMPITPDEVAPAFNAALADVGAKRSSVIDIAQFIRGGEPASLTGTGGIGLSLQLVDGRATIVRANAGGPAWAENFVAGSVLLAIDDTQIGRAHV